MHSYLKEQIYVEMFSLISIMFISTHILSWLMKDIIKKSNFIVENSLSNPVHIAFATDRNFINYTGVSIFSILKNNRDRDIVFHIFSPLAVTDDFDKFSQLQFDNFSLVIHEMETDFFDNLQISSKITTGMYYRLVIPEFLKDITDKVLYLDTDILCYDDFGDIFELNLDGYIISAINDEFVLLNYKMSLGIKKSTPYFNSGVMMFNTKAWVKYDVFNKFISLINVRKYEYPDQDVLNIILENKVIFLPKQFNCFSRKNTPLLKDAVFVHYAGYPKPWSLSHHDNCKYLDYYFCSPWKDVPLVRPDNRKECKVLLKKYYNQKKYGKSIYWYLGYLFYRVRDLFQK